VNLEKKPCQKKPKAKKKCTKNRIYFFGEGNGEGWDIIFLLPLKHYHIPPNFTPYTHNKKATKKPLKKHVIHPTLLFSTLA